MYRFRALDGIRCIARTSCTGGVISTPIRHLSSRTTKCHLEHRLAPVRTPLLEPELRSRTTPRSDAERRTIYALSTPPGKAGVAVVRVSGPDALSVWASMVQPTGKGKGTYYPEPWKMYRCRIVHCENGQVLDDGLAVFFKGPQSFTTQDVVELHVHSGRAVLAAILSSLARMPCCRPAERGEFTRQAFDGGRLDLTQVEGLRDLVGAETEVQRRGAVRAVEGVDRMRYEEVRAEVVKCLAMVEALIDFGEGEDLEEGVYEQARERVVRLRDTIQGHLSDKRRGEILRSGIRLAIFGPPNAGKSSLFNFLAQREAAIVTPVPGTTRDILEVSLDLGGLPVIAADTAGLRRTEDVVEKIGVERAKEAIENADVGLCVLSLPETLVSSSIEVPESVERFVTADTFVLVNKKDLVADRNIEVVEGRWVASLETGEGVGEFLSGFTEALQKRYDGGASPLITQARHRVHLESAVEFLDAFLNTGAAEMVLGAEELRYAAEAVGKISGVIGIEEVLDVVFRDFCIGK